MRELSDLQRAIVAPYLITERDVIEQCELIRRRNITCRDGATMSVQASARHYCSPKRDNAPRYRFVEVGQPTSRNDREIIPSPARHWRSVRTTDLDSFPVYSHVPVQWVRDFIHKHGGLVAGELPPGVL